MYYHGAVNIVVTALLDVIIRILTYIRMNTCAMIRDGTSDQPRLGLIIPYGGHANYCHGLVYKARYPSATFLDKDVASWRTLHVALSSFVAPTPSPSAFSKSRSCINHVACRSATTKEKATSL
jgi:hypothetical protein